MLCYGPLVSELGAKCMVPHPVIGEPVPPRSPAPQPMVSSEQLVIVIPAKAMYYVFTGVGLSVCLFVCLLPR